MQAELALDYFELRGIDTQKALLDTDVASPRQGARDDGQPVQPGSRLGSGRRAGADPA